MTIPQWVLLGFAGWTLAMLFGTIGVYRWSGILTGRARISEWRADTPQGSERYRRAMRAHLNCVENLPVYGAIVFCASAAGARGVFLDALALAFMAAQICQTIVHIAFAPSDFVASMRFALFFVQAVCMVAMGISAAASTAAGSWEIAEMGDMQSTPHFAGLSAAAFAPFFGVGASPIRPAASRRHKPPMPVPTSSIMAKKAGTNSSDNTVDTINPPMTAIAIGERNSPPAPTPKVCLAWALDWRWKSFAGRVGSNREPEATARRVCRRETPMTLAPRGRVGKKPEANRSTERK